MKSPFWHVFVSTTPCATGLYFDMLCCLNYLKWLILSLHLTYWISHAVRVLKSRALRTEALRAAPLLLALRFQKHLLKTWHYFHLKAWQKQYWVCYKCACSAVIMEEYLIIMYFNNFVWSVRCVGTLAPLYWKVIAWLFGGITEIPDGFCHERTYWEKAELIYFILKFLISF